MKNRITVHSDNLNRHKYRVLSKGIKTEAFMRNPVMFFGHNTYGLPIGTWEGLQREDDGRMTAIPVFDEVTDLSKACKALYDAGTLRAASIHFMPLAFSEKPEDMLPGQQYATVTESEMLEISMVGIPGNGDATLALSVLSEVSIPPITNIQHDMDFKKIAASLGLPDTATEAEIVAAIEGVGRDKATLETQRLNALIQTGKDKGVITDATEAQYRTLAASNYEAVSNIVHQAVAPVANPATVVPPANTGGQMLSGMIHNGAPAGSGTADPKAAWTFDEWSRKDEKGLLSMKQNDPERYKRLAQERLNK